ncbi:DUF11 domain-containing protein [Candidatus Peregrinibacteria bacterium]|nr:DUF11 domain-containing protein [Candidatus Peregrinibacteria bacterium]MBI3816864.1 DUF11 domain-containing protein [Candidatus Peregrinibacteria bacterium]
MDLAVRRRLIILSSLLVCLTLADCASKFGSGASTKQGSTASVTVREESGTTVYYEEETASSASSAMSVRASSASARPIIFDLPIERTSSSASSVATMKETKETLRVSQRADKSTVQAGGMLGIDILLSNDGKAPLSNIKVEDTMPLGKLKLTDAGGGTVNGNRITWTIGNLQSQQVRVLHVEGRANRDVTAGDSILNVVAVRGGDLRLPTTSTAEVRIVQKMPQTGRSGFTDPIVEENVHRIAK